MALHGKSYIGFIILVVVFVVLLALVLGRGKAEERKQQEQIAVEEQLVYPDFNPNAAANITISSLTNNVIDFRKISGYWMVADGGKHPSNQPEPEDEDVELGDVVETDEIPGEVTEGDEPAETAEEQPEEELKYFRADETLVVDGLLSNIAGMERGVRRSKHGQSEQAKDFGTDPESGIEVKVDDSDGNLLAHFYVGKQTTSSSNFIRFQGEDEVYEVPQAWRNLVGRPVYTWRDKTMFDFAPGIIDRVQIIGAEEEEVDLVFVKDAEGGWTGENTDWPLDGPKIDTAINRMSTLKASDWPQEQLPANVYELIYPTRRVIAEGGGERYELIIFEVGEGKPYYASTGHDNTTFVISQADVDIIYLDREDLEVPEPPEPAVDEASG